MDDDPRRRDGTTYYAILRNSRSRHNADRARHDRDQTKETSYSHSVSSGRTAIYGNGVIQPHKFARESSERHPNIKDVDDSNRNGIESFKREFRKSPASLESQLRQAYEHKDEMHIEDAAFFAMIDDNKNLKAQSGNIRREASYFTRGVNILLRCIC